MLLMCRAWTSLAPVVSFCGPALLWFDWSSLCAVDILVCVFSRLDCVITDMSLIRAARHVAIPGAGLRNSYAVMSRFAPRCHEITSARYATRGFVSSTKKELNRIDSEGIEKLESMIKSEPVVDDVQKMLNEFKASGMS